MPIRGERGAPSFDQKHPHDLEQYFEQLETLFARCKIEDDLEKKRFAVSFVESEVADSWKALAEYKDQTKTYADLKDCLFEIYNQVSLRYILSDLDQLVGERQRLGMRSLKDLTDFHLRFNAIASYLLANQLISAREQSQSYMRVFEESIQARVVMRLQIRLPNHHPALPYPIDEIYQAAKWVLQGVPGTLSAHATTLESTAAPPESTYVKQEQLGSFLNDFAKTIVAAMSASSNRNAGMSSGSAAAGSARNQKCNFDGCERFIRDCPLVEEYIRQGRCRRNIEGKVVLPSGAFVPRDIPGQYLRDRIDEWHKRNPNQLANGTLFNAVVNKQPVIPTLPDPEGITTQNYQLSAQDRIAALEVELFNLRVRHQPGFVPVIKTRKQRANEQSTEAAEAGDAREQVANARPVARRQPTPTAAPVDRNVPVARPQAAAQPTNATESSPEHPFRNAKEAVYVPPQDRNIGAPAKPPTNVAGKRPEAAYRTSPPIHDAKIANNVYHRALEAPFTITYHELLSLAPEVRAQVREAISSKRVPNNTAHSANLQNAYLTEEELSYLMPDEVPLPFVEEPEPASIMALATSQEKPPSLPSNAIIVEDPIDEYYKTLRDGESPDPDQIVVAKESSALRSIIPLVNNCLKVEAILDPGCQIVAMSEDVCHELALPYDPTVILHMQSANGTVDPSLGLARNVPFLVGDLTFYIQVHVIRGPAYDILLGRPFDVLTESVVRNFRNEDQTITIHDPNSNRVVTLPTVPRGPPKILSKGKQSVFRSLRP
jgi:hypothetical protein